MQNPFLESKGSTSTRQRFAFTPGSVLNHSFTSATDLDLKIKIPPPASNGPAEINFPSLANRSMLAIWPSMIFLTSSSGSAALSLRLFRKTKINSGVCANEICVERKNRMTRILFIV
jgi:hypothetical protein